MSLTNNSKLKTQSSKLIFQTLLPVAAVVFVLDQLTKWWVVANIAGEAPVTILEGVARLRYTENRGAAFGLFQGWGGFLSIAAIVVVVAILYSASKLGGSNRLGLVALGLITGGALGNLLDRLRLGYVVDFVDVYGPRIVIDHTPYTFPVFNVADSGVTIGAILLIGSFLFAREPDQPPAPSESAVPEPPHSALSTQHSALPTRTTPAGWAGLAVVVAGLLLMALRVSRERS